MDGTAEAVVACAATFNTMAGGRYNATCLVMIKGGDPGQIHSFAGDLAGLLGKLSSLLSQLQQQKAQLMQVWTSTKSAPAAVQKLTQAFTTFQHTIDAIDKFIKALHTAADAVDRAMNGANKAVQLNDPMIGQLLATQQPASQAMARARAAIMDSGVSGFLQGQSGALTGAAGTMASGTSNPLGTILQTIGSAINGTSATPSPTAAPATTGLPATPVAGTPISTVPGALQSYPYGYPTGTGTGFIPVDPNAGAAPAHHVEVDFGANGDLVAVKADIDADVDVQLRNADGTRVERMVHVKSDGTTTTV